MSNEMKDWKHDEAQEKLPCPTCNWNKHYCPSICGACNGDPTEAYRKAYSKECF
jgi:hypothetical protein